jgi:hypothetical protein
MLDEGIMQTCFESDGTGSLSTRAIHLVISAYGETMAGEPGSVIPHLLKSKTKINHFEALTLIKSHYSQSPVSQPWLSV